MITIKTTYEQVSTDYPEVVQEFLDNLRNSTSKSKDMDIKKIKWFYSWGTFNKKAKSDTDKILRGEDYKKRLAMTYDERWENESEKIKVEITMEAGAFVRGDRCKESELPTFITRYAKELLKGQMTAEQEAMEVKNQNVIDSIGEIDRSIIEEIFPPKLTEMMNQMQSQFGDNKAQRKREITYDVDDILDKISDSGFESLSDEEKKFLENQ